MTNQPNQLPEKFLNRLSQLYTPKEKEYVLQAFSHKNPPTFRANTLKISPQDLREELAKQNILVDTVPWYQDAFILTNQPQKVLTATQLYIDGYFYVQSLSSMLPPLILNPQPGEKILDITAAPGSKTTQMAVLMENTGEIIANDKSRVRLYKLEANLKQQGVTNTKITYMPAQTIWKKFPEYFDKTLVDVPCSMEGRFYTENPKSYADWSTNKIDFLQDIQKYILRSATSATKVGGEIVYSTCTLSPEENEAVIDWIIKKEQGAVIVEPVQLPNLEFAKPLTHWKQKTFDAQISNTARILPSARMEGFFIAKLKKIHSTFQ